MITIPVKVCIVVFLASTTTVSSFTCDDGCEIPGDWVDDQFCDCATCEDESRLDCDVCECPTECGDFYPCFDFTFNSTYFGWSAGYDVDDLFLDCEIGGREVILISIQSLILLICLCLVIYFSYRMCKHPSGKQLHKKFKILVTICNVLYFLVAVLSFAEIIGVSNSSCHEWANVHVLFLSLVLLQISFHLALVFMYINFTQRFVHSLKNTVFELTKMKCILNFFNIILFVCWTWFFFLEMVQIVMFFQVETYTWFWNIHFSTGRYTYNLLPRVYVGCSMIAIIMFVYKFRHVVMFFGRNDVTMQKFETDKRNSDNSGGDLEANKNENKQQVATTGRNNHAYERKTNRFVSVVSRTTVLVVIGLVTTCLYLVVNMVIRDASLDNFDQFMFEFINVAVGIDAIINILCLNMQFQYGEVIFKRLKCFKITNVAKKCILACYSTDCDYGDWTCCLNKVNETQMIQNASNDDNNVVQQ